MVTFNKQQDAVFARIAGEFNLDLLLLFGSQVKNRANSNSDVDIGIVKKKSLTLSSYSLLAHRLGKALGNYKVDLTILKHASPLLLGQVAKNCQLLYEKKKGSFLSFRLSAMKKYADAFHIFKLQEENLRRKIKKYQRELAG